MSRRKMEMKWAAIIVLVGLGGCMDQYHPEAHWTKFDVERRLSSRKTVLLTEKGDIPPPESAGGAADPISEKFASLCASCHGADGKADAPAAASMNPKPRNFHDAAWQAKVNDEHIAKVIREGGTAVGLSATMPPWGAALSAEDIDGLVKKIRGFSGK